MLGLILFAITTPVIGVILAHKQELRQWLVPFGAGLMLTTICTHILPEIFEHAHGAPVGWALLAGFGLYFVLSAFLIMCPHEHDQHCTNDKHKGISILLILGFVIHALIDGVAIYALSEQGVRDALIGLSVHRAIDGVALVALAIAYKMPTRTIYEWFGLILASTIAGYGIGTTNLNIPTDMIVAFACGTLLYILAADMIPQAHKNNKKEINIVSMLVGIALAFTLSNLTIHTHAH